MGSIMTREDIINRISKARTNANLSARALSQNAGLNDGYINRLESKKDFLPSMESFIDIVEACGITLEEFFYYDMSAYKQDKEIIDLLKHVNSESKDSIIKLLKNTK